MNKYIVRWDYDHSILGIFDNEEDAKNFQKKMKGITTVQSGQYFPAKNYIWKAYGYLGQEKEAICTNDAPYTHEIDAADGLLDYINHCNESHWDRYEIVKEEVA
jgi:hypothetical protein